MKNYVNSHDKSINNRRKPNGWPDEKIKQIE